MDRDEEKDLYIKSKLKDGYIPERIDNLFNNSAQIFENKGEINMEEKEQRPKKNKNQIILKRVAGIAACAVIALGGGQIYASTQGYDNIFFMIKEWIAPSQEVQGKDEILSDRDITISYEPIQITENIRIVISKMQIKDNEAKISLLVNRNNIEDNEGFSLEYKIYNSNKKILCNQLSEQDNNSLISTFEEELILDEYTKEDKVLNLEIYKSNSELITTITIDLENKEINVVGQEEHIEKISEIELKEFLGNVSAEENLGSSTCIDISNISYSGGYYTVTYIYCYLGENSLFDIDINSIEIYQNTVGLKLNEDGTFKVVSMEEPIIIQKNKAEIDNSTSDTNTPLWQDFSGTYALKTAYNQGNEIKPKEWSSWSNNNWVVFYDNGTFKDTLFSKIFTNKLTVGGTYRFQDNSVILTYDNGEIITLEGDVENCTLTGEIDEYDVTIVGYSHSDLSKYDSKFVGTWHLQYGKDWTTLEGKEIGRSELYDANVYGEILGIHLTLEQNGNMEYLIGGSKKTDRYQATWECVTISENKIKVTLDENTIIYMDYYASEIEGQECISFQSINNNMYHEYYYKTELNSNETENNENNIVKDEKFVGTWNFEYAFDWSTGVKRELEHNDLYNKEVYGEISGVNLTIEDNGNYEYSIGGSKKVDRYAGTWERDDNSNNTLKIKLDEDTIIFVNYHETDDNGVECLSFQSKQNEFAREYYYK